MFVHEQLRYLLLDQSLPVSEIEWLHVDIDGYKIVSIYKPPPMPLQSLDLPVFPHPYLYAGNFNCHHINWGYNDNSLDGECMAGQMLIVLPSYTMPRMLPTSITPAGTWY